MTNGLVEVEGTSERLLGRGVRLPPDRQAAMDTKMLEMRAAGMTFEKIAEECQVSYGYVWGHVTGRMLSAVALSADKVRARQAEIVLAAINGLWPAIIAGNTDAIRTVTSLLAHEAKLFGANSPEVSELRQSIEVVPSKAAGVLGKLAAFEGHVLDGEASAAAPQEPPGAPSELPASPSGG